MRTRVLAAAGAVAAVASMLPAHASTSAPKPQITDPAGDANGINDQGFGLPVPSQTTPYELAADDLTGLTFRTVFTTRKVKGKTVRTPVGSTVTVGLAAAPDTNTFYVVDFTSTGSCKSVSLIYDGSPSPAYNQNRADCIDSTTGATIAGPVAKVVGKALVWTLPLATFPVKTTFAGISGQTLTGLVPAVELDGTAPSSYQFTVGR